MRIVLQSKDGAMVMYSFTHVMGTHNPKQMTAALDA